MSGSYAARSRSFIRQVLRQSFIALTWIPPVIFFENHVASIAIIDGISMKPTFNPESNLLRRDWVLENKWFMMQGKQLERGDVVTLRSPLTNRMVTKRVVGTAGDIVATRAPRAGRVVTIPLGHVWVEGDERYHSSDSNEYGPVAINMIEAKIQKIIWPPTRFGDVLPGGREPRISSRQMSVEGNSQDWMEGGLSRE